MRRPNTLYASLLTLLMFFAGIPLLAAGARPGWTKVELSPVDGTSAVESAGLLKKAGGELIADYGAYAIVYVPSGAIAALETEAAKGSLRARVRDDLDVLQLPGATVDARKGTSGVAANRLLRPLATGQKGIFVVQFAAPLRAEWMDALRADGWEFSRYIPSNGYLLVGSPELMARTRKLPYIQWLDYFHPYQKAAALRHDGAAHDQLFELPGGAGTDAAIEAIRDASEGEIEITRSADDTRVYARMTDAAAEELLRNEMILAVGPRPVGELSDERQAMSLTSNLDLTQTQPTNPGGYWSWVTSRCTECATMPASGWKVGFADSGLDDGGSPVFSGGHPDLFGRKFYGGAIYTSSHDPECTAGFPICDKNSHGTLVAGIAVGSGASGVTDSGGFLLAQGVAPTAGAFMTKFASRTSFNVNLFGWAADAANNGVAIQNHSWNEYSTTVPGTYTALARDFDIAARDADGGTTSARIPLLLTVSAGNTDGPSPAGVPNALTLAGATAKNVLSMGGLETFRPGTCVGTFGDAFNNIMKTSRVGTALSGYIKPDLMAPASLIVSAHTSVRWPNPSSYCLGAFGGDHRFTGHSGTSFAAPVGAAASLIVKRYLGATPSSISPALTRAVLIAGARSVRNGQDRTKDPAIPVGPVPSQQQGFGRLSLEDILDGANKPVVFDQDAARTFTNPGQSFTTQVRVRDASKPVKIALVYTDAPGTPGVANPLVNDLNLEVRRSSNPTSVYIGNKLTVANGEESTPFGPADTLAFDNVNNVEFFRLFLNPNEDLTITVTAANIAGDTNGIAGAEQDFALAILNAVPVPVECLSFGIVAQPQSQSVAPGQSATLSVGVTGTGPFIYQWYQGASGVTTTPVGTNSSSFTTPALSATTQYWVKITDGCSGVQLSSNTATITVQCTSAPVITTQPASSTIASGQSVTLSVAATQAQSYQWYIGTSPSTATPIGGATGSSVTVTPSATTSYWVRVTNSCGVANSSTATICVLPGITAQPASRTITAGQSTTLNVTATNATSFQWYVGAAPSTATPIGGNSSSLTVTPAATTSYWVRVTNACGFVNSTTATVTVVPPAIMRVQSNFSLVNSQTSITATWPAATQAGNFLVAVISADKDPNPLITWTAPAGWILANSYEWNFVKAAVYYLPNNAGGRTSETFTVTPGFHDQTLYLLEYSGMLNAGALDRTALNGAATNNGSLQTGFTANTTQAKELVITVLTTHAGTSFSTVPADGYAEVYDKTMGFPGYNLTTAMYEKLTNTIGSYGHNASVAASGHEWVSLVVTFRGANP